MILTEVGFFEILSFIEYILEKRNEEYRYFSKRNADAKRNSSLPHTNLCKTENKKYRYQNLENLGKNLNYGVFADTFDTYEISRKHR